MVRGRFFFLVLSSACSQVIADDFLPLDASPTPLDATIFDASPGDADSETAPFKGGGPFMCGACVCDGTLYLCSTSSGGTANAPFDLDASDDADDADAADDVDAGPPLCAHDAGAPCTQIPIECLPKPTCDCILPNPGSCSCSIDPSGNGFRIDCVTP